MDNNNPTDGSTSSGNTPPWSPQELGQPTTQPPVSQPDFGVNPIPPQPSEPAPMAPTASPEPPAPPSWMNPPSNPNIGADPSVNLGVPQQPTPTFTASDPSVQGGGLPPISLDFPASQTEQPGYNTIGSNPTQPTQQIDSTQSTNPIDTPNLTHPSAEPTQNPIGPNVSIPTPPPDPLGMPAALDQPPPAPETAPTDLSHLITDTTSNNNPPNETYNPPVSAPENLVVPNGQSSPAPQATVEAISSNGKHMNISKILIIVGVLVVLIVAGLSAYFILGIGQTQTTAPSKSTPDSTTSDTLTNPPGSVKAPAPLPSPAGDASGAASLTDLDNSTKSASPKASAKSSATPKASSKTSAVDLLKSRSTPSPSTEE